MTVAFRSDAAVINATAGTSVTVSKPSGTTDGDFLLAFVAELGVGTITAPGGWTLLATQDVDADLRLAVYRKFAASEGASWTWTLSASVRNWGWVGAYTGVHPADPVVEADGSASSISGTDYGSDTVSLAIGGPYVQVVAAYRTATGSATTWTAVGTEQLDHSTNAGSGSDISGAVYDSASVGPGTGSVTFMASQTQTKAVTMLVALRPFFTLPAAPYDWLIEMAFGADPDGDPDDWTWTDITSYVRQSDSAGISFRLGRSANGAIADAAQITMTLDNADGRFTPGSPTSLYYPNVRRNTPVRFKIQGVGSGIDYEMGQAQVDEWTPGWSTGDDDRWISIVASGRFRRWGSSNALLYSVLRRLISGDNPVAYWPMEDASGSATLVAASPNTAPMQINSLLTLAGDDTVTGSAPLLVLSTGAAVAGNVTSYSTSHSWTVEAVVIVPVAVAATTVLLEWRTPGTPVRWQLVIVPGTPDTFNIRAFNTTGGTSLDDAVTIVDSQFYGLPLLLVATASQNGTGIDYTCNFTSIPFGGFGSSGTIPNATIGNVAQVSVKASADLNGATVGHIAVFDSDITFGGFSLHASGLSGHIGETPLQRYARLCNEEGIPYDFVGFFPTSGTPMGPQPIASRLDVLRECEVVDGGLLVDCAPPFNVTSAGAAFPATGLGGLFFVSLTEMINRPVDLTIDMDSKQLAPPFGPTYDDQLITNDVTVSRPNGSSARVIDVTGPVGVLAEGRYDRSESVNVQTDNLLPDQASWRVNVGTVRGMRYPQVMFDLRRSPALAQAWLETHRIGIRVQLINLPSGHPPDPVDLIVVGYEMGCNAYEWRVRLVCVPAQPFVVWEIEDGTNGRVNTGGCVLVTAVDSDDTTLSVCTYAGPLWITNAAFSSMFPFDIEVGGERITCTALAAVSAPAFVASGAASHADNAAVSPALPAGVQTGDLLLVFGAIRSSGTGTLTTPTGYTLLLDMDNARLWGKIHSGSEVAPTLTPSGGASGDTVSGRMAAFRGMCTDLTKVTKSAASQENASAVNIAIPGLTVRQDRCIVLYCAWRQDDWTGAGQVSTPAGFTEIGEDATTTGNDQGIVWGYQIQATYADIIPATLTVSTGGPAISRAGLISFVGGTQAMTVSRSGNTVVKSHAVGADVSLWRPPVLSLAEGPA